MELLTIRGGWGRNRRFNIENGDIRIRRKGFENDTTLYIKDGLISEIEETEYFSHVRRTVINTQSDDSHRKSRTKTIKTIQRYDSYNHLLEE